MEYGSEDLYFNFVIFIVMLVQFRCSVLKFINSKVKIEVGLEQELRTVSHMLHTEYEVYVFVLAHKLTFQFQIQYRFIWYMSIVHAYSMKSNSLSVNAVNDAGNLLNWFITKLTTHKGRMGSTVQMGLRIKIRIIEMNIVILLQIHYYYPVLF